MFLWFKRLVYLFVRMRTEKSANDKIKNLKIKIIYINNKNINSQENDCRRSSVKNYRDDLFVISILCLHVQKLSSYT